MKECSELLLVSPKRQIVVRKQQEEEEEEEEEKDEEEDEEEKEKEKEEKEEEGEEGEENNEEYKKKCDVIINSCPCKGSRLLYSYFTLGENCEFLSSLGISSVLIISYF